MNEEIKKIIEYLKNEAWFTIFNAEEYNDEPYKLLNPIEVNQIIDYITKLQNNWNELKKRFEEYWQESKDIWFVKIINIMQELEGNNEN